MVATGYSDEIHETCMMLHLDLSKIIFLHNNKKYNSEVKNLQKVLIDIYDTEAYEKYFRTEEDQLLITKMQYTRSESSISNMLDYVRYKTFELVTDEIKKADIPGETAELGVYRGEFAALINEILKEKKLYLFDTFEGFDLEEIRKDVQNGYATTEWAESYKNTSVELVLSKMKNRELCIVKKGYFPETAQGLEEKFSFVSIDVDLEDAIYNGLVYFYPRLSKGGYIFVHDYNSSLEGVKRAVERYEKEFGRLVKVPLCDISGTLVLSK